MNKEYFTITKDNKTLKYNVLFILTENDEKYIVYTNDNLEVLASKIISNNNNYILKPIKDKNILDKIDKELSNRNE